MVKKLSKFIGYFLFFIMALIVFMPKSSLYFLGEKNLKKQNIIISNEKIEENLFSLNISDMDLYVKGIQSAKIKEADITFLLFYNSVDIKDIKISSVAEAYLPTNIDRVNINYTIFNPLVVNATSKGGFGQIRAKVNLLDRKIKVYLKPSKKMLRKYSRSMRYFKKDAKGEYVYAKTF